MSYSKSSVIQLRELSGLGIGNDNYTNGQYEVDVDETTLNDGDMLSIKSCIIDSATSEDGKIVIEDDETDFSITFNHYIKNFEIASKRYNRGDNTSLQQPDGLHYFLCDTADASPHIKKINSITFNRTGSVVKGFWGKTNVVFTYVPAGQTTATPLATYTIYLDKIHNRETYKLYDTLSKNDDGTSKGLGFNYNSQYPFSLNLDYNNLEELEGDHNVDASNYQLTNRDVDTSTERSPHDFTLNFTMPTGSYDPSELARIITDKMTKIRVGEGNFSGATPMENNMMTTNNQFFQGFPTACPNGRAEYCSETGEDFFDFDDQGHLSGASQFGLQFDLEINKFKLTLINNPYYVDGNVSVQSIKRGTDDSYFLVNKTSGLTMKSMTPQSVWFKKMGFNNNILISSSSTIVKDFTSSTGGAGLTNQTLPVFSGLIEGVNTTGSYKGLDMVVRKNGKADVPPNPHGTLCPPSNAITTITNDMNVIFAQNSLQKISLAYGYFMIEVGIGLEQDFKGSNLYKNNIHGVIGRYYSTDSFTTAYNEGSIPYIHRGTPVKLSQFKVRILDDTGEVSTDVGNNNTIFLEITKNVSAPSAPAINIPLKDFLELKKNQKP
tara:strand:- start:802 stop:2622 length:1821 start_codon:yes stop_codon:yes gene_type:complete